MKDYVQRLTSSGLLTTNKIWMDVEAADYWFSSCDQNQNWLSEALLSINMAYKGCGEESCVGIKTSATKWSSVMCNTSEFSNYTLCYVNSDNTPTFTDFSPFGGWESPACKQYARNTNSCTIHIDKNYY